MEVFQFSKKRSKKSETLKPAKVSFKKTPSEPPVSAMFVHGKKATAPEWRVSQALDKIGLKYIFQYSILGGLMPGGQVLDFYIFTVPLPTPLNVQGEYWHRSAKSYRDALKQNQVNKTLGNRANPLVLLWERNLQSVDEAYKQARSNLGGV